MIPDSKQDKKNRELNRLLLDTASRAGIEVIEDRINRKGGVCRLEDRVMVIYDSKASIAERNRLVLKALSQLTDCYLPPLVRELLDGGETRQD